MADATMSSGAVLFSPSSHATWRAEQQQQGDGTPPPASHPRSTVSAHSASSETVEDNGDRDGLIVDAIIIGVTV